MSSCQNRPVSGTTANQDSLNDWKNPRLLFRRYTGVQRQKLNTLKGVFKTKQKACSIQTHNFLKCMVPKKRQVAQPVFPKESVGQSLD